MENSPSGLTMLPGEATVSVTGEENHQRALGRYPVGPAGRHVVAVELVWCTITDDAYRGERAIEVRLDGFRVGELTYLMSLRYKPQVDAIIADGGRVGCAALIHRGVRGIQIDLRLPRSAEPTLVAQLPPATVEIPLQRTNRPARKPAWIIGSAVGAGVVLVVTVANAVSGASTRAPGGDERTSTVSATSSDAGSSAATQQPTTTTQRTRAIDTTKTGGTTHQTADPPHTTKPTTPKKPKDNCNPNYTPCVPDGSHVHCAHGNQGNQGDHGNQQFVRGPVYVIGADVYGLDRDGNGVGCDE